MSVRDDSLSTLDNDDLPIRATTPGHHAARRLCAFSVAVLVSTAVGANAIMLLPNEDWTSGSYRPHVFADVTGDGRADGIRLEVSQAASRVMVRPSFGAAMAPDEIEWRNDSGEFFDYGIHFADVTGDGRADLIQESSGDGGAGIRVWRSTGSDFRPSEHWHGPFPRPTYGGPYFGDVTGDGLADMVTVWDTSIVVNPSTFVAFGSPQVWLKESFYGELATFLVDVTGDRRADLVALNTDNILVRKAWAGSFGRAIEFTSDDEEFHVGERMTMFADMDGDLQADLIRVNDDGVTIRRTSNLGRFLVTERITEGPYFGSRGTFFADVTGDGLADGIVANDDTLTTRRASFSDCEETTVCAGFTAVPLPVTSAMGLTQPPPWTIGVFTTPESDVLLLKVEDTNLRPNQMQMVLKLGGVVTWAKEIQAAKDPCEQHGPRVKVNGPGRTSSRIVRRGCQARTLILKKPKTFLGIWFDVAYLTPSERMWDLFAGKRVTFEWGID